MSEYLQPLQSGCEEIGLGLSDKQYELLLAYLALFAKWNKAYNLSAVRNPKDMISRHLLDSLSVVPALESLSGKRFIDVGTGGGLPGIPLAIARPDLAIALLDSNGKKTRFLTQVKLELGLTNISVINTRVETYQPEEKYDVVISRAFASLEDMVSGCQHLLHENGCFAAMKGVFPKDELSSIEKRYMVERSLALHVPETVGERHLLIIRQAAPDQK